MSKKFSRIFVILSFLAFIVFSAINLLPKNSVEYSSHAVINVYSYPDLHGSCVYPIQIWHDPLWQSICLNNNEYKTITINGTIINENSPVHVKSTHGDKTIIVITPTDKPNPHQPDEEIDILIITPTTIPTPTPAPICQNNPHC